MILRCADLLEFLLGRVQRHHAGREPGLRHGGLHRGARVGPRHWPRHAELPQAPRALAAAPVSVSVRGWDKNWISRSTEGCGGDICIRYLDIAKLYNKIPPCFHSAPDMFEAGTWKEQYLDRSEECLRLSLKPTL